MSEGHNSEELHMKITNLEKEVATLSGENDRLNSEIKLREKAISEFKETQISLEAQVKAAHIDPHAINELKKDNEKQAKRIIELEDQVKHYQEKEASRAALEKQLHEIEEKSKKYLKELAESKSAYELEIKHLNEKLSKLASKDSENEYNSEMNQLVDLKIIINVRIFLS